MNSTCTVVKTQRLRKLQTKDEKATVNATALPGVKRAAARPLLVTFRSELEQASVLKNAKSLQHSDFSEVFVRKWLTKEQREVEKDLRTKCKSLNDHNKPLENRNRYTSWLMVDFFLETLMDALIIRSH